MKNFFKHILVATLLALGRHFWLLMTLIALIFKDYGLVAIWAFAAFYFKADEILQQLQTRNKTPAVNVYPVLNIIEGAKS